MTENTKTGNQLLDAANVTLNEEDIELISEFLNC